VSVPYGSLVWSKLLIAVMEGLPTKSAEPFVLKINGGSSSIKFALYPTDEPLRRSLYGKVDRIGLGGTNLTFNEPIGHPQDSIA
jgi:hypothetical protein